ncbi:MAG TPA: glycosyltransferase family 4 protein [Acidimicrobiales bacterium]|nr:glycosyltransferase family 4 protein [Acidimicrobiales bacterium]
MRALHQFVPTFEPGAVGGHMLELQRLARETLGVEAELFAEFVHPAREGQARKHTDYGRRVPARPGDVLVYHVAIGSVVADFVRQRPEALVVDHHNITPPELYERWEPAAAYGCSWGRAQLPELASRTALGVADSAYNEDELRRVGFAATATAPILLDPAVFDSGDTGVDPAALARLVDTKAGADWLFVGRVSPNKCQHDVVKAFAAYRRMYDPAARLHVVGGSSSVAYWAALEGYIDALGLGDAVRLTGAVTAGELLAHYLVADAFVCLSEHEGFCIPLLEAMANRVPIVAFASSAVPGTLGDAGVLLASKRPGTVAAAVHRVLSDAPLRAALVAAGTARLDVFSLPRTRARWLEVLRGLEA